MSEKYKNKYRIDSIRLKNWDYKWNAAFFFTICTKHMIYYFGNVVDGKMQLNEIGKIAENEWLKTLEMRPDMNLSMGEFVVMPNHFHAILIIGENEYNARRNSPPHNPKSNPIPGTGTDAMHCVSSNIPRDMGDTPGNAGRDTDGDNPTGIPANPNPSKNQFGPQSKNLASIIRGFKIGLTTRARTINSNFAWQPRYYEHIIRDERAFKNISNYIINNPANWQKDKFA